MSLQICLLLILTVVGTHCLAFRFGGSAAVSSHSEAGVKGGVQIGVDEEGHLAAKTGGKLHGDWSGGAGAGGYAGVGKPEDDPKANVTGAGLGGLVTAHVGGSTGAEAGGVVKNGRLVVDGGSLSHLDGSSSASGGGFLGTATQQDAEQVGGYGRRMGSFPGYGGQFGSSYGYYGLSSRPGPQIGAPAA